MSDEKTKKRAKHTPGPWWADVEHGHIFAGEGQDRRIADVRGWGWLQHQPNPEQTQDANARLIAAAPEMADALRVALAKAYDPDENVVERFDRVADEFYRATGYMRPGKAEPMGFDRHTYEEREAAFKAWVDAEARKSVAAMRAALAKAGVTP